MSLRTCPGCGRSFAMLHICERCGRCDAQDLPRDAGRQPCCADGADDACVERDWRSEVVADEPRHITAQLWSPEQREDGVYLVGEDGSAVLKLCRPDRGSDLILAGYVVALQAHKLPREGAQ